MDAVQTILDLAGLIPVYGEFADGANALIYLARGDDVNAGLSAAAMIPLWGWLATGGKLAGKVAGTAVDVGKVATKSAAKTTLDYMKDVQKIDGKYFAPKNIIDEIGQIEAKDVNFSSLRSKVTSIRPSAEGGVSKVIQYSDNDGTRFIIHEVTDYSGRSLHRDFDAVRIQSGQIINKLPK